MNKKTEESYFHIFEYIETNIFQLEPDSFTTVYEKAMRNGLKSVYKNVLLVSCWFHYCQALRRKCSKITDFFKNTAENEAADRVFHKFLALPLLPPGKIREAFTMLKLAFQCMDSNEPYQIFLKYFENQWLKKVKYRIHLYILYLPKLW
jgi:hypothetical protein